MSLEQEMVSIEEHGQKTLTHPQKQIRFGYDKFIRFEKESKLDMRDVVTVRCMIFDNFSGVKYGLSINIFNHVFSSGQNEECSLREYHADRKECQFIGFFQDRTTDKLINKFSSSNRIPYILHLNMVYPRILNMWNIPVIRKDTYNISYSKDQEFFIGKLEYADAKIILERRMRDETIREYEIQEQAALEDEFVVIGNTTVPIFTIYISDENGQPIIPTKLYEIVREIFFSQTSRFIAYQITITGQTGLDLSEINANLIGDYYYDGLVQEQDHIVKIASSSMLNLLVSNIQWLYYHRLYPIITQPYQEKYLKYKGKYITLKNQLKIK